MPMRAGRLDRRRHSEGSKGSRHDLRIEHHRLGSMTDQRCMMIIAHLALMTDHRPDKATTWGLALMIAHHQGRMTDRHGLTTGLRGLTTDHHPDSRTIAHLRSGSMTGPTTAITLAYWVRRRQQCPHHRRHTATIRPSATRPSIMTSFTPTRHSSGRRCRRRCWAPVRLSASMRVRVV